MSLTQNTSYAAQPYGSPKSRLRLRLRLLTTVWQQASDNGLLTRFLTAPASRAEGTPPGAEGARTPALAGYQDPTPPYIIPT